MQISGPGSLPSLQLRLPAQSLQGIVLQNGATLQATVHKSDTTGQLTLEISGKLLQAISSLRLAAGITLQLRVEKTADGILLHLDEPEQQRLIYHDALRRELPRQESLRPLLQRLAQWQVTQRSSAHSTPRQNSTEPTRATPDHPALPTSLPKPVAQAIVRLLAVLPTLEQLVRPEGLQQAITRSGLFLEQHLLQSARPTQLDGDVKTVLLRLADTIRQQLNQQQQPSAAAKAQESQQEALQGLLRQVEAGIARIQLNQLNALGAKGEGEERLYITMELPLYHPKTGETELLRIQIKRDGSKGRSKSGAGWSVILHLSPEGYGDINAVVALHGGRISTTFWCEEEHTAQLFREQLHQLEQRLVEQGVETVQCSSRCGRPADMIAETANHSSGLIDTRA